MTPSRQSLFQPIQKKQYNEGIFPVPFYLKIQNAF